MANKILSTRDYVASAIDIHNTDTEAHPFIRARITTLGAASGNWNSVYTTVQSNSAINWNYQGTDLKALSGNWQSAYNSISNLVPYSGASQNVNLASYNISATEGNFGYLQVAEKPNFSDGINILGSSYATWSLESKSIDGVAHGQGLAITNSSYNGYMNLGVEGEIIFGGSQLFFGFNDRNLAESGRWGMYGVNGGFNFWNNEASTNIMSFTKNNHIAIGVNGYDTWNNFNLIPATLYVDAQSDGYPTAMFLNGNVLIGTTTDDGYSALQVNGSVNATGYYANGTPPVADGTYTMGFGATQNGTITVVGGIITAITEAIN